MKCTICNTDNYIFVLECRKCGYEFSKNERERAIGQEKERAERISSKIPEESNTDLDTRDELMGKKYENMEIQTLYLQNLSKLSNSELFTFMDKFQWLQAPDNEKIKKFNEIRVEMYRRGITTDEACNTQSEAAMFFQRGLLDRACSVLEQAISKWPKVPSLYALLGGIYLENGYRSKNPVKALAILETARVITITSDIAFQVGKCHRMLAELCQDSVKHAIIKDDVGRPVGFKEVIDSAITKDLAGLDANGHYRRSHRYLKLANKLGIMTHEVALELDLVEPRLK